MRDLIGIIVSLVRPLLGFEIDLFRGRYGWRSLVVLALQGAFQTLAVTHLLQLPAAGVVLTVALLMLLHTVSVFLSIASGVGLAFTPAGRASGSSWDDYLMAGVVAVVPAMLGSSVILAIASSTIGASAGAFVSALVASVFAGTLIDVAEVDWLINHRDLNRDHSQH